MTTLVSGYWHGIVRHGLGVGVRNERLSVSKRMGTTRANRKARKPSAVRTWHGAAAQRTTLSMQVRYAGPFGIHRS